jgi:O-antigen ligase
MSFRNFSEIIRLSKPIIFSIVVLQADADCLLKKVAKLFVPLSILLIIIVFVQYLNIMGMAEKIGSLYAGKSQLGGILNKFNVRAVGTGSDPNIGAGIILIFFIYNMFYSLYLKNLLTLILTILLAICIFMTSSRTAVLAMGAILIVFLLKSNSVKFSTKIFFGSLLSGIIIVFWNRFQRISEGLLQASSGENISLITRFILWQDAWDLFLQSPVFGWGPAKKTMTSIVDGEYFLLLRRYGIIGTFFIIFTIFTLPFWCKKPIESKQEIAILHNTLIYYVIAIFFIMITNVVFSGYQLFLPFAFFCLVDYKVRKHTRNHGLK